MVKLKAPLIPAKAGIQLFFGDVQGSLAGSTWIPAFAGMSGEANRSRG
jgi:hypothetical protein